MYFTKEMLTKIAEEERELPMHSHKKGHRQTCGDDCKFFVYGYEYKHIVSAWCIDSFDISKEVTMYDDPMYNDWENRSIEYKMSTPPMNPNFVAEYKFIYGENGSPSEYSRTEYRYCNVGTGQWKASKKVFEKFAKNGISWFNK